jgi:zinc transporter 1/2/3
LLLPLQQWWLPCLLSISCFTCGCGCCSIPLMLDPLLCAAMQVLLSDWLALRAALTPLIANATANADAEVAAAAAFAAATSDTQAAMKEAATWSGRLTEQYVAQAAMVADVVSGGMLFKAPPCNRSSVVHAHFQVQRGPPSGTTGSSSSSSSSRRLQQLVNTSTPVSGQYEAWQGYVLDQQAASSQGGWGLQAAGWDTPERARYLGPPGRNRLVAGLLLHATRKPTQLTCDPFTLSQRFTLGCAKSSVPHAQDQASNTTSSSSGAGGVMAYLAQLFGPTGVNTHPYGVDPVFLRSSDLYQPGLVGQEGAFYNTSNPAEVVPATGIPFGYFHRPLRVRRATVLAAAAGAAADRALCSYKLASRVESS